MTKPNSQLQKLHLICPDCGGNLFNNGMHTTYCGACQYHKVPLQPTVVHRYVDHDLNRVVMVLSTRAGWVAVMGPVSGRKGMNGPDVRTYPAVPTAEEALDDLNDVAHAWCGVTFKLVYRVVGKRYTKEAAIVLA
jgi:ribosomal protein S27AE